VDVAVVTGPGRVELRREPDPVPADDQLIVEVGACGLCTMERRLFAGEKQIYPVAPGHEVAGRVVAAGDLVRQLDGVPRIGDAVTVDLRTRCGACSACRRGHTGICKSPQGGALSDGTISMGAGLAHLVAVPARHAFPTGDARIEHAAMGEPLACVAHSLRAGGLQGGDRVGVIGGGYMGRLHLALARHAGAVSAGIIDVSADRRADAEAAGASWVATPDDAAGRSQQCDIVFVTAGVPGAVELALSMCDDGGNVVLYGAFDKSLTTPVGPDRLHHHEISVIGVVNQEPEDWRTASGLLASGVLAADLDRLVTARFTLNNVLDAFSLAATQPVYRVLVGS
jgi:threonine dehydrogenase-like Zn-dependent dehydrogenase